MAAIKKSLWEIVDGNIIDRDLPILWLISGIVKNLEQGKLSVNQIQSIRLNKISITNYKGIDELELEFPSYDDVPDIIAMGSR